MEYDALHWQLEGSYRKSRADQQAGVTATTRASAESGQLGEPDVPSDRSRRSGQQVTLEGAQLGETRGRQPDEYLPPAGPDAGRGAPPEVYKVIADQAHDANGPDHRQHGQRRMALGKTADPAEWVGEVPIASESAEAQTSVRNNTITHTNEAHGCEPDTQAGE